MPQQAKKSSRRQSICLPFESEAHYEACVADTVKYREYLEQRLARHPELFPAGMAAGFTFHDRYHSVKQKLVLHRLKLNATGAVFQLRPSFVLPYQVARTQEVEKALYLRQWGVPFDALAYVFGRDPMFWYRVCVALGHASVVGTTLKDAAKLPEHLVADEKHSWLRGKKVYLPTTAAEGCVLGVSVVTSAETAALEAGYGEFAAEARELNPAYQPQTVCTDGWKATREAWQQLFPSIRLILCFLHAVLKIRDRCRHSLRHQLLTNAWHLYHAATRAEFSQRLRRLREWAQAHLPAGPVREAVLGLCRRGADYVVAYAFPQAARTSNGVDRLLNQQDRGLYAGHYFHGTRQSARLAARAMALLWNFHPYGCRTTRADSSRSSPFGDLNGFVYHDNWLHNLLIASSLGGHKL